MYKIDTTDIAPIIVEIDGMEHPVASKTVETVDKLLAAQRSCEGLPEYQLWLAELRVLLGKKAVETLFCSGEKENIDRIHRIHAGVVNAFEYHAAKTEAQIMESRTELVEGLLNMLSNVADKLEKLTSNAA